MSSENRKLSDEEEYPDFNRIATAGKTLTLGRLYDILEAKGDSGILGAMAQELMVQEAEVANNAYRTARGIRLGGEAKEFIEDENRRFPPKKDVDKLIKLYIFYGLASGPHQATEMVREIESQAVAQVPDLPSH